MPFTKKHARVLIIQLADHPSLRRLFFLQELAEFVSFFCRKNAAKETVTLLL